MRMDLLNQTPEAEPTKSRAKPRKEITQRSRISPEGRDKTNQGVEAKKDTEKSQEVREQTPNKPTDRPNNQKEQGSSATPMEGEIRDDNTPMQDAEGEVEMTPSEVGTEDLELRDLVEREGIDLMNILEQWKRQGVDNVPTEQLDRIQYLFLLREEAKARGLKRAHGEIGHLGVKSGEVQPQLSPKQMRRKKGRKSNSVAL
jgi:hypothetical protein